METHFPVCSLLCPNFHYYCRPFLRHVCAAISALGYSTARPSWCGIGSYSRILQTNVLTAFVCRTLVLTHITNQIFDISLVLQDQDEFLKAGKHLPKPQIKHRNIDEPDAVRNFNTVKGSWVFKIPKFLFGMVFKLSDFTTLTLLSLIPIIGPILANQLMAPRRTYTYLQRYFLLRGFSKKEAKDFQYEHYASFICFGMSAGLLEIIPFFTIITISSNTVGAAKWCSSLLREGKKEE